MSELAAAIRDIPIPAPMQRLPRQRGFPVPWFVAKLDGEYDFRVIERGRVARAVNAGVCWLCGNRLGRIKVSVIGPMGTVNRITSEPPSHPACARYAVRACPHLTNPRARRNAKDLPEEHEAPPGIHIDANPGASVLWSSLYPSKPFDPGHGGNGVLFALGAPYAVEWWTQGRPATRQECLDVMKLGLPRLSAAAEADGPDAVALLAQYVKRTWPLLP